MVFNREWTDVEQMRDFIVTFAHLNMTQNLRLTVCDQFSGLSRHSAMLMMTFMKQHAHQCHMHVGHQQFQEICMTLGQRNGNLRESE